MKDHTGTFVKQVLDPGTWETKARHLLAAAALFESKIDEFWSDVRAGEGWKDEFVAVFFMLSAFALENLVKARIVRINRDTMEKDLRSEPSLPGVLKGHDLYKLFCLAGRTALADEEKSLLERLSNSAVWYARYPSPVRASGLGQKPHWYSSNDLPDIKRLLREFGGG